MITPDATEASKDVLHWEREYNVMHTNLVLIGFETMLHYHSHIVPSVQRYGSARVSL